MKCKTRTSGLARSSAVLLVLAIAVLGLGGILVWATGRTVDRVAARVTGEGGQLLSGFVLDADGQVFEATSSPLEFTGSGDAPDRWIAGPFWYGVKGGGDDKAVRPEWADGVIAVFATHAPPGRAHELAWMGIAPWPSSEEVSTVHGSVDSRSRSLETYLHTEGTTSFGFRYFDLSMSEGWGTSEGRGTAEGWGLQFFAGDESNLAAREPTVPPPNSMIDLDLDLGRIFVVTPSSGADARPKLEQISIGEIPPGPPVPDAFSSRPLVQSVLERIRAVRPDLLLPMGQP